MDRQRPAAEAHKPPAQAAEPSPEPEESRQEVQADQAAIARRGFAAPDPPPLSPTGILALQSALGNRAFNRLLSQRTRAQASDPAPPINRVARPVAPPAAVPPFIERKPRSRPAEAALETELTIRHSGGAHWLAPERPRAFAAGQPIFFKRGPAGGGMVQLARWKKTGADSYSRQEARRWLDVKAAEVPAQVVEALKHARAGSTFEDEQDQPPSPGGRRRSRSRSRDRKPKAKGRARARSRSMSPPPSAAAAGAGGAKDAAAGAGAAAKDPAAGAGADAKDQEKSSGPADSSGRFEAVEDDGKLRWRWSRPDGAAAAAAAAPAADELYIRINDRGLFFFISVAHTRRKQAVFINESRRPMVPRLGSEAALEVATHLLENAVIEPPKPQAGNPFGRYDEKRQILIAARNQEIEQRLREHMKKTRAAGQIEDLIIQKQFDPQIKHKGRDYHLQSISPTADYAVYEQQAPRALAPTAAAPDLIPKPLDKKQRRADSSGAPLPHARSIVAYGLTEDDILPVDYALLKRNNAADKKRDQVKLMGGAASAVAKQMGLSDECGYEWLHLRSFSLVGKRNAQTSDNLVLGTEYANTQMITLEEYARELVLHRKVSGVRLDVSARQVFGMPTWYTREITYTIVLIIDGKSIGSHTATIDPLSVRHPTFIERQLDMLLISALPAAAAALPMGDDKSAAAAAGSAGASAAMYDNDSKEPGRIHAGGGWSIAASDDESSDSQPAALSAGWLFGSGGAPAMVGKHKPAAAAAAHDVKGLAAPLKAGGAASAAGVAAETTKSGNCLYEGVAIALGQGNAIVGTYRALCTEFLLNNPGLARDAGLDIDAVINVLSQPGAWSGDGGDTSPVILATVVQRTIRVVADTYQTVITPIGGGGIGPPITLYLHNNHYTVRPVTAAHARPSAPKSCAITTALPVRMPSAAGAAKK
jgi:hypothetical protein